jgi:hypothetical protein
MTQPKKRVTCLVKQQLLTHIHSTQMLEPIRAKILKLIC